MDFITLKKRAARDLKVLDISTQTFITGRDINEEIIGQVINDAYLDDIVPLVMSKFPYFYERKAYSENYSATGTVDAASTGTTLVATTDIFTNSMVGLKVINSTDNSEAKITAYTSATTVTLDTTIDDTWDGDTIYVLDNTITFLGEVVDMYTLRNVFVRYDTNATRRHRAVPRLENDVFQTGMEVFTNETSPFYFLTTVSVSDVPTTAMKIFPYWHQVDNQAIEITYTERPVELEDDSSEPHLPKGHQEFLYWKAVEVLAGSIRKDFQLAQFAAQQFESGKQELIRYFQSALYDNPVKIRPPRRVGLIARRRI